MTTRTDQVRTFFETPERYLGRDFGIRLRAEIVRDLTGGLSPGRILDAGCGDGSMSLPLLGPAVHLTLVDLSAEMLAVARRRTPDTAAGRVDYVRSDILRFHSDRPFDLVVSLGLLAHVDDPAGAIGHLASLVAPGGHCVLQCTDPAVAVARLEAAAFALRRRFADDRHYAMNRIPIPVLLEAAARGGLAPVEQRRYSLLLPGMGRLPDAWLLRWQRATLKHSWLSRHGSEVILLLTKPRA